MTLAKVGGLVGKVLEVDEESRYRYDYVSLRIACRDVSKVPKTAEGTLGMYIIDFGFERELPKDAGEKILKSGIKVSDERPNKKSKAEYNSTSQQQGEATAKESSLKNTDMPAQETGKQVPQVYWSAPPKIDFKRKSQTKLMADAQKRLLQSHRC